jgi:hypothetical protein
MSRHFVHDRESNKLHVRFADRADFDGLPEADRRAVHRTCLWSGSRGCWVSRAKVGGSLWALRDLLGRLAFEDRGAVGEAVPFADRVEKDIERAAERAERMEGRAADAREEAHARFNSLNVRTLIGLGGEPVKLDHHSARKHLNLIEKADNDMRKGVEATDRARHYDRRAEAAAWAADAAKYVDPVYLGARIAECEKHERDLLRRMSDPRATDADRARWTEAILEHPATGVRVKLAFYRSKLAALGAATWTRETLADKAEVLVKGEWRRVLKVNPKTVSVDAGGFRLDYPHFHVRDAR